MKKRLVLFSFLLNFCIVLIACTNENAQAKTNSQTNAQSEVQNKAKAEKIQATQVSNSTAVAQNSANSAISTDDSTNIETADLSILILGDSLAAGYGIVLEKSWVHLLEKDLEKYLGKNNKNVVITNGSISGETTGGGLARLDELLTLSQADIVVIELGGNDGLRGYPVKSIRKNLASMIQKSRAAGAKVLLCGIMIPPNYGERYANAFAQLYPKLSDDLDVPLVPFILDGVALNDEMMQNDGIHPNELGQPRIRDNVMHILQSMLPK